MDARWEAFIIIRICVSYVYFETQTYRVYRTYYTGVNIGRMQCLRVHTFILYYVAVTIDCFFCDHDGKVIYYILYSIVRRQLHESCAAHSQRCTNLRYCVASVEAILSARLYLQSDTCSGLVSVVFPQAPVVNFLENGCTAIVVADCW